jgi:hypothetical protein
MRLKVTVAILDLTTFLTASIASLRLHGDFLQVGLDEQTISNLQIPASVPADE